MELEIKKVRTYEEACKIAADLWVDIIIANKQFVIAKPRIYTRLFVLKEGGSTDVGFFYKWTLLRTCLAKAYTEYGYMELQYDTCHAIANCANSLHLDITRPYLNDGFVVFIKTNHEVVAMQDRKVITCR